MNSEKINLYKGNNKFKEKNNTNFRYALFKNDKSFNIKFDNIGSELNLKMKYSFLNNFRYKNSIYKQFWFLKNIIYFLIIFFLPIISLSKRIGSELRELNSNEEITIKVKEGEQKIINNIYFPDKIILNGNDITQTYKNGGNVIIIEGNDNTINLIWNNKLCNCSNMFLDMFNIISIDLSKFDLSLVESMAGFCFKCISLESVNFGNANTSSLKEMNFIFTSCHSLISLDFSSFNTKKVTNMGAAFSDCTSLEYIDVSSFDTSKVKDLSFLFCNCSSLHNLDIHHFNTSSAINMYLMFNNCTSLESLDLSNFNTDKVNNMLGMFENCYSLISLHLDNFNTKGIKDMSNMFNNCSSLISLDLSNFNMSSVTYLDKMFDNCNSLIFLNLISFKEMNSFSGIPFRNISKDVVYCIDDDISISISYAFKAKGLKENCSDTCFLDTKKIDIEKRECIFYCENSEICKYENKDICCDRCPNGTKPKNNICEEEVTDLLTETNLLTVTDLLTDIVLLTDKVLLTDTDLLTDSITEKKGIINCTSELFFKKIC